MTDINKNTRFYRFLEMLPGTIAWSMILFIIFGSLIAPRLVAYSVIAFLVFWFYQSAKTSILGISGYLKIKKTEKINWQKKYRTEKKDDWLAWDKIKNIILIPNYNESVNTLSRNLNSLANQQGINPKEKLVVVLAMEQRAEGHRQRAEELINKFKDKFKLLTATYHPPDIVGEIKGKASNEAWAAQKIKQQLVDRQGWNIDYLTVTSCDADAEFHRQYFACLNYHFAKNPKRYLRFWQSPIFWYNNLHQVPAPIRVVGVISNIIYLAHMQDPDGLLFNYSSYSLSLKLLNEVGYWDTDIIPEDWHIFFQTFFAKQGKISVEPIFTPTHIDAPEGKTYWQALRNRYLQCQRHAWGATDIPYAIIQARRHPEVPFLIKALRIYKLIQTHLIWSTNWFILTLGAALPPLLNPKFFQTSLGYNLPKFSQLVLTVCLAFLATTIILDLLLKPKPKEKLSFWQKTAYILQWITMPISTLFMSVLPGLDAQTKLLFGKRLEYWVTEKY